MKITITERGPRGNDADDWPPYSTHYDVTVTGDTGESFVTEWHAGPLAGGPTVEEVSEVLRNDAASVDGMDFPAWVSEYGFDLSDAEEHRKIRETYDALVALADNLRRVAA